MFGTREKVESELKRANELIDKIEEMKVPFYFDWEDDKVMELLKMRIDLEGTRAKLEFILNQNLVD